MKKLTLLFFTLLISLSACAGNSTSLEGKWTLIAYGDSSNLTLALPSIDTSIDFDTNNQIGGNMGCNTFGGEYKLNGNQITISGIFSTLMFCEGASNQETAVLNILSEQTLDVKLNGNQLTLTSADGLSVIVLERK